MNYLIASSIVLSALFTASNVWAFERDLTGIWKTSEGTIVGIDQTDDQISLSLSLPFYTVPDLKSEEFIGTIHHRHGMGSNDFHVHTEMSPVTIRRWHNGRVCDVTGTLDGDGIVLGTFPGRSLDMTDTHLHLDISCRNGKSFTYDEDFNGEWL